MSEKSHVSMEHKICLVCQKTYSTNNILLDASLKQSMERKTITGFGLCPEHDKEEEGFVLLIESDIKDPKLLSKNTINPKDVNLTGKILYIKKDAYARLFDRNPQPISFVEIGIIERLTNAYIQAYGENDTKQE